MSHDVRTYAIVELEVVGLVAFDCPRCGNRNTCMVERGHSSLVACSLPPHAPKGSRAAALLTPKAVVCGRCHRQFRVIAGAG